MEATTLEKPATPARAADISLLRAKVAHLLEPFRTCAQTADPRGRTLPILANVMIARSGTGLRATATDLEHEVVVSVELDHAVAAPASTTVNAKRVHDILARLDPEETVTMTVSRGQLVIRSKTSTFRINTLPVDDFPTLRKVEYDGPIHLTEKQLRQLLGRVEYAAANGGTRYFLCGTRVEIEGKAITAVATDGNRLAATTEELVAAAKRSAIIVPRRVVTHLVGMLEDSDAPATLRVGHGQVEISFANVRLVSKLVEGTFPNWRPLMKPPAAGWASVSRATLLEALNRAGMVSSEKLKTVRLVFEPGTLALETRGDMDDGEESMDLEYAGHAMTVAFNLAYLSDAVERMECSQVEFGLSEVEASVTLRGDGNSANVALIQPCRD